MTPVHQTQFVASDGRGNCVQAAIASILDLPLAAVPAFRDLPAGEFEPAVDRFLYSRGLRRISLAMTGAFEWGDLFINNSVYHPVGDCMVGGPPVLLIGDSPRGKTRHAVVGQLWGAKWEVIHDPHPDGTGLAGDPSRIDFIVPLPTQPPEEHT